MEKNRTSILVLKNFPYLPYGIDSFGSIMFFPGFLNIDFCVFFKFFSEKCMFSYKNIVFLKQNRSYLVKTWFSLIDVLL